MECEYGRKNPSQKEGGLGKPLYPDETPRDVDPVNGDPLARRIRRRGVERKEVAETVLRWSSC